jgi:exopolysaccharide biosynthesis polyprenyl glycosylphosphotransferase
VLERCGILNMTRAGTFVRRNFEPLVLSTQVLADLCTVVGACLSAWWLREQFVGTEVTAMGEMVDISTPLVLYREIFSISAAVCLLCFHWFGMYSPIKSLLNVEEFKAVSKSTLVAFLLVNVLVVFLRGTTIEPEGLWGWVVQVHRAIELQVDPDNFSRVTLTLAFALICVYTMVARFISFKLIQGLHKRGVGNRNVLILGAGTTGQRLQRKFLLVPTLGLNFAGFVDDDEEKVGAMIERSRVLGTSADLAELVGVHKASEVFVALPSADERRVMEIVAQLEQLGVRYYVVPRFYHLMSYKVRIESIDSIPLIARAESRDAWGAKIAKRTFDLAVSSAVLLLGAPFFLFSCFLIKRDSPGPILFKQVRIGRDGRPFSMLKFRTMYSRDCADAPTPQDEGDPRITRVGRFLRRYSLDELPNFVNVLKGEMSVVGPRPEMPFIVENYGPLDRERLRAKPGVTGLWQISYARGNAIHENLDYDLYYIENQSLLLDLVICALTGFAVAKGTGAY